MMNALHEQVGGALSISHLLFTSTKPQEDRLQKLSYQNTLKFRVSPIVGTRLNEGDVVVTLGTKNYSSFSLFSLLVISNAAFYRRTQTCSLYKQHRDQLLGAIEAPFTLVS